MCQAVAVIALVCCSTFVRSGAVGLLRLGIAAVDDRECRAMITTGFNHHHYQALRLHAESHAGQGLTRAMCAPRCSPPPHVRRHAVLTTSCSGTRIDRCSSIVLCGRPSADALLDGDRWCRIDAAAPDRFARGWRNDGNRWWSRGRGQRIIVHRWGSHAQYNGLCHRPGYSGANRQQYNTWRGGHRHDGGGVRSPDRPGCWSCGGDARRGFHLLQDYNSDSRCLQHYGRNSRVSYRLAGGRCGHGQRPAGGHHCGDRPCADDAAAHARWQPRRLRQLRPVRLVAGHRPAGRPHAQPRLRQRCVAAAAGRGRRVALRRARGWRRGRRRTATDGQRQPDAGRRGGRVRHAGGRHVQSVSRRRRCWRQHPCVCGHTGGVRRHAARGRRQGRLSELRR
jgi:hypothetical protein